MGRVRVCVASACAWEHLPKGCALPPSTAMPSHDRSSADPAPRAAFGGDFRRVERPDPDQRPLAALLPRGRVSRARSTRSTRRVTRCRGCKRLSRPRLGAGRGGFRPDRGARQSRGRRDGGLRREGRARRRHVHRRLRRDRRRGPRVAGADHQDRARQRHPPLRSELPRPLQHADRPHPDLLVVPRGGADRSPARSAWSPSRARSARTCWR